MVLAPKVELSQHYLGFVFVFIFFYGNSVYSYGEQIAS